MTSRVGFNAYTPVVDRIFAKKRGQAGKPAPQWVFKPLQP
jgi:hypothetical protein